MQSKTATPNGPTFAMISSCRNTWLGSWLIARSKEARGDVFAAVLSLLNDLNYFISDTGTKAAIQWSVFVGVVTSEKIAWLDEELGHDVLEK